MRTCPPSGRRWARSLRRVVMRSGCPGRRGPQDAERLHRRERQVVAGDTRRAPGAVGAGPGRERPTQRSPGDRVGRAAEHGRHHGLGHRRPGRDPSPVGETGHAGAEPAAGRVPRRRVVDHQRQLPAVDVGGRGVAQQVPEPARRRHPMHRHHPTRHRPHPPPADRASWMKVRGHDRRHEPPAINEPRRTRPAGNRQPSRPSRTRSRIGARDRRDRSARRVQVGGSRWRRHRRRQQDLVRVYGILSRRPRQVFKQRRRLTAKPEGEEPPK